MIVSQILTNKAIQRLLSIARGEPQPEETPAAEAAEETAANESPTAGSAAEGSEVASDQE